MSKKVHGVARDSEGNVIGQATIGIYLAGTSTLTTIYSDNGVTEKANPFPADDDGAYEFYIDSGLYRLKISKTGYQTFDEDDLEFGNVWRIAVSFSRRSGSGSTGLSGGTGVPDPPSGMEWTAKNGWVCYTKSGGGALPDADFNASIRQYRAGSLLNTDSVNIVGGDYFTGYEVTLTNIGVVQPGDILAIFDDAGVATNGASFTVILEAGE
jgi:hypothetical protein